MFKAKCFVLLQIVTTRVFAKRVVFFRFPKNSVKVWEKRCRRQDRRVSDADRIFSCHFKDGKKENGPTLFPWNQGSYFDFGDPNAILRRWKNIKELTTEVETLKSKKQPFSVFQIINDEKKMLMYTFLKADMFKVLDSTIQGFPLTYINNWNPGTISRTDQLFMTLMKLKLNCLHLDLAERFNISKTTVQNIVTTHIFALHEIFFEGMIENKIPSLLKCKSSMPTSFGDFNCCRLVIDATEVTKDIPGQNMMAQSQTHSSYKNRHTFKSVTGVAPNGAVVYVSKLYPGSTSDVAIVEHSNMLSELKPGDMILADKGFTIYSLLPAGVHLNIPPFLKNKGQYTPAEVQMCRKIARSRIHVERVNERIKIFEILSHIPHTLRHLSTKIFQVCCILVNFQDPMIAEIAENFTKDTQ